MVRQTRLWLAFLLSIVLLIVAQQPVSAQSSSTFTYQGYLSNASGPVTATCDLRFTLFGLASGGSPIGGTLTRTGVSVQQGVFSVQLDFGATSFNGTPRYLELGVKCGAEPNFTALTPRQALTVAPLALTAFNAPNHWALAGNANTNPTMQFLGTTDAQPIEVRVNNQRTLRLEPFTQDPFGHVPNVIAGSAANVVSAGVYGATIGGGGASGNAAWRNAVLGVFGTVSGGQVNTAGTDYSTVGGGQSNTASGHSSTVGGGSGNTASGVTSSIGGGQLNTASQTSSHVGGGQFNSASGERSVVGGGSQNIASGTTSVVSGGASNTASGTGSTVGGGSSNIASGTASMILGGSGNTASGVRSFAAGTFAKANDDGAFVWADSQIFDIFSPGVNTFAVRANGGIWLGTGGAPATFTAGRFIDTSTGAHLTSGGAWTNSSDRALKANFTQIDPHAILEAVAALPITAWNYTAEGTAVKHLGPTAQDFRAAFKLGQDDKSISTVDAAGVALAAIQALKAENDALKLRLSVLEAVAGGSLLLPALVVGLSLVVGFIGAAVIGRQR